MSRNISMADLKSEDSKRQAREIMNAQRRKIVSAATAKVFDQNGEPRTFEPVTFTVLGTPRGKERPRLGKHGVYTPKQTVEYENAIAWAAKEAMQGRKPTAAPVSIQILAVFAIPQSFTKTKRESALLDLVKPITKPDFDNVAKAFCDSCNGIVYLDDCQIVRAEVSKVYGGSPHVVVVVKPV